jgi:hypothetical protein
MPEVMIFKAGKYPQGDWPKERVQKMAGAYGPKKNTGASAVTGRRFYSSDDEYQNAHGWAGGLRMDGAMFFALLANNPAPWWAQGVAFLGSTLRISCSFSIIRREKMRRGLLWRHLCRSNGPADCWIRLTKWYQVLLYYPF